VKLGVVELTRGPFLLLCILSLLRLGPSSCRSSISYSEIGGRPGACTFLPSNGFAYQGFGAFRISLTAGVCSLSAFFSSRLTCQICASERTFLKDGIPERRTPLATNQYVMPGSNSLTPTAPCAASATSAVEVGTCAGRRQHHGRACHGRWNNGPYIYGRQIRRPLDYLREDAIASVERAHDLDPLSLIINVP
jgi:hypothetical protein